ncbi:hypothetical protein EPO05_01835 [Patescibacteria group bacterium]|nr:MAG: hypothetical protein EPO05_01835 [Patescibacteria group bacterium]
MENKKILLGLTTTRNSDWRGKVEEAKRYNISELSLFLTGLNPNERQEIYQLLENSPVTSIPHVHLRSDMEIGELEYLTNRFRTQAFNIHSRYSTYPSIKDYSNFMSRIYVENASVAPTAEELADYGGLCVDFSHLEAARAHQFKGYEDFWPLLDQYPIGCCHLSPFPKANTSFEAFMASDWHWVDSLNDFDYVTKYLDYLPELISLEVANPFEEQLLIKENLNKVINKLV